MVFPVPCGTHVIVYTIRRCTLLSGLTCCLGGVNREHLSLMQPLDLIWGQHRLCPSVSEPVCSCTYLWTFLRYLTVIFTEILNDKYISVWLLRPDEWRGQPSAVSRVQSCYMLRFCLVRECFGIKNYKPMTQLSDGLLWRSRARINDRYVIGMWCTIPIHGERIADVLVRTHS